MKRIFSVVALGMLAGWIVYGWLSHHEGVKFGATHDSVIGEMLSMQSALVVVATVLLFAFDAVAGQDPWTAFRVVFKKRKARRNAEPNQSARTPV